jgi:hypothetical protein
MARAAPVPWFRLEYQTACHRIAVRVAELLPAFLFREHNEIVEAMLPDLTLDEGGLPETRCSGVSSARIPSSKRRANACLRAFITTDGSP